MLAKSATCSYSQHPILMMGTNCTKCNLLILPVHLIKKSLVREHAIVSMIMLNVALRLSQDLLKGVHSKNGFIHREIVHEVNVNKITNVIAECSTSPDSLAREETGHLWDETRLRQHNLIH